jgi:RNA polymerase sigma-70 factor (ECF subfamily)
MHLKQIIDNCKKKNKNAQKALFYEYNHLMSALCKRYISDKDESDDVLMQGWINIFNKIESFNYLSEEQTICWMRKILINQCLMYLRKKKSFLSISNITDDCVEVNEAIISSISANEIYELIQKLPIGYRTVFNLYVIEGYTHKEIAALLGIKEGTSKSQLNKAKQLLQSFIINQNNIYAKQA